MLADDQPVTVESAPHILVYGDTDIPTRFYYASTRPAVARGSKGYQLTLTHYDTPVDGIAGMLSLVVNLQPDQQEMDALRSELSARNPGETLQFVPMPWTAGTVAVAVGGGAPLSGMPSLLGDNSAALSISLSIEQYQLLRPREGAVAAPLYVVYSLSYDAMRPEYAFWIHFDASRFRDWMQKKCSASFLFISVEKSETFEELRQAGVLRVESENRTGEEPPAGFRQAFLCSLQSVLVPLPRFAQTPQAGGSSWLVGVDCGAVRDIELLSKRLDTDMRIKGVVSRKAYIQGELAGLAEALAERGVQELPTRVSFTQPLTVRCHDSFQGMPVEVLNAQVLPAILPRSFHSFERSGDEWHISLTHKPGTDAGYTCLCTPHFGGDRPAMAPVAIPIARAQAYLDIVPSAYFSYRNYSIGTADDFPWQLVREVRLELRGPVGLAFRPGRATLVKNAPSGTVEAFAPERVDLEQVAFSAQVTPNPRKGLPFTVDGVPAGATVFFHPLRRRVVTFRGAPGGNWDDLARIVIVVSAVAGRPQLWDSERLVLLPEAPHARFTYWHAGDKTLSYQVRYIRANSREITVAGVETAQAEVVLSIPEEIDQH